MGILGITESRRTSSGLIVTGDGSTILFTTHDDIPSSGVAQIIRRGRAKYLIEWIDSNYCKFNIMQC